MKARITTGRGVGLLHIKCKVYHCLFRHVNVSQESHWQKQVEKLAMALHSSSGSGAFSIDKSENSSRASYLQ